MSRKEKYTNPPSSSDYIISAWQISLLEGQLLTLIEAMGLPQKQEEAVKGLFRQKLWEVTTNPLRIISAEDAIKIFEKNDAMNKQMSTGSQSIN